jgi:hypothetical protein
MKLSDLEHAASSMYRRNSPSEYLGGASGQEVTSDSWERYKNVFKENEL